MANTAGRRRPNCEMTTKYIRLDDAQAALEYAESVLSEGGAIGSLISKNLSGLEILAFVPEGTGAASVPPFRQGVLCGAGASRTGLISLVEQHLSTGPQAAVIFEDVLARPDDDWLQASALRIATYAGEVYYILLAEDAGTERVAQTVTHGFSSYHQVAVFSDFVGSSVAHRDKLSRSDIDTIVANVRKLAVGAFDGESFLLLEK